MTFLVYLFYFCTYLIIRLCWLKLVFNIINKILICNEYVILIIILQKLKDEIKRKYHMNGIKRKSL